MQVVAHGVDVVECERIAALLQRHGPRFTDRMLTTAEQARAEALRNPVPHIAGRFAAKEAILKLLGTGWRDGIAWTDMEITNDSAGAPHVQLHNAAHRIAEDQGIEHVLISISHTDHVAMASALGLGTPIPTA